MAEEKIKFTIGSTFKGEGFNRAASSIKQTTSLASQASAGIKMLGPEFSKLGEGVGKVASGIGGLFASMAAGPVGVAVAGLMLVVTAFQLIRDQVEKTRKAHEEAMQKMQERHEAYSKRVASYAQKARAAAISALDASIKYGEQAIDKINKLAAAYKNLGAAEDAAIMSSGNVEKSAIDLHYASLIGRTDEQRKGDQLQAAYEKTLIDNKNRLIESERNLYNANRAVENITKQIPIQQGIIEDLIKSGKDAEKERTKLTQMEIELATAQKNLAVATNNHTITQNNCETAAIEAERAVNDYAAQMAERAEQERKAAEAAARKEKQENLKEDAESQIEDVNNKVLQDVARIDSEIDRIRVDINNREKRQEREAEGMASDARHYSGIDGNGYEYTLDRNGNINNQVDRDRAERYAARADRDAASNNNRQNADDRKFDNLMDKWNNGKYMSDREKQWLDNQRKIRRQQKADDKLKEKEAEKEALKQQLPQMVKEIRDNLKKALEAA